MAETPLKTVPGAKISPVGRFLRLLKSERKDIISIYIYAIIAGLISLSLPLGIQAIFNYVAGGQFTTSWVVLVAVVILGVFANGMLQIFQISIVERMQQRIFTHSAMEFSYRIPRIRVDALRLEGAPELASRFFDTLTVQKGISKILMDLTASTLQILFGLLLLSFYHPFFIAFSVVLIGLLFLVIRLSGPSGLRTSLEESKYKYKVAFWLEEMARTLESFKFAGNTPLPLLRTNTLLGKYLDARQKHFRVLLLNYGFILGFKVLIIGSMLLIGSFLVLNNELNIGQFVAMEIVVILLLGAVDKLIFATENAYDVLTALEKIATLTDLQLETEHGHELPVKERGGLGISVRNLTLQFPDMRDPILENVNLELKPGEKVNLVTTDDNFVVHFFRLITGFYDGYQGTIVVNGLPLQNIQLEGLRNQIGGYSTLQEIFDGTVVENITLGLPGISMEQILEVVEAVGLTDFVHSEAEGLDTKLRTGGGMHSATVCRKIILARSIVRHPELLMLNSPFEGLEQSEKARFMAYLHAKMPNTTVILVTRTTETSSFATQTYVVSRHTIFPVSEE